MRCTIKKKDENLNTWMEFWKIFLEDIGEKGSK